MLSERSHLCNGKHSKEAFRDGEFTETEGEGHQGLEEERMGKYCLLEGRFSFARQSSVWGYSGRVLA